jgi:hypothetical protein
MCVLLFCFIVLLLTSLISFFFPLCLLQRGAPVQRRYSEFVFLWDVLVRRYPFRLLPALPPKRVGRQLLHFLFSDSTLSR